MQVWAALRSSRTVVSIIRYLTSPKRPSPPPSPAAPSQSAGQQGQPVPLRRGVRARTHTNQNVHTHPTTFTRLIRVRARVCCMCAHKICSRCVRAHKHLPSTPSLGAHPRAGAQCRRSCQPQKKTQHVLASFLPGTQSATLRTPGRVGVNMAPGPHAVHRPLPAPAMLVFCNPNPGALGTLDHRSGACPLRSSDG